MSRGPEAPQRHRIAMRMCMCVMRTLLSFAHTQHFPLLLSAGDSTNTLGVSCKKMTESKENFRECVTGSARVAPVARVVHSYSSPLYSGERRGGGLGPTSRFPMPLTRPLPRVRVLSFAGGTGLTGTATIQGNSLKVTSASGNPFEHRPRVFQRCV